MDVTAYCPHCDRKLTIQVKDGASMPWRMPPENPPLTMADVSPVIEGKWPSEPPIVTELVVNPFVPPDWVVVVKRGADDERQTSDTTEQERG